MSENAIWKNWRIKVNTEKKQKHMRVCEKCMERKMWKCNWIMRLFSRVILKFSENLSLILYLSESSLKVFGSGIKHKAKLQRILTVEERICGTHNNNNTNKKSITEYMHLFPCLVFLPSTY